MFTQLKLYLDIATLNRVKIPHICLIWYQTFANLVPNNCDLYLKTDTKRL